VKRRQTVTQSALDLISLSSKKMGDYAKFEAYDSHWLVVPEFKYLIIRIVPEESTRVAMLKTGELDIGMETRHGEDTRIGESRSKNDYPEECCY